MDGEVRASAARPADDGIRIRYYEDWMLGQVVEMFQAEYGRDPETEQQAFLSFYEHPFQREHGIRLAAVDGERVCGFQSFFSWPYVYQGRQLSVLQSGRSLVSPHYRGHRVFARLLNFLWETDERPDVDFLMGFPVEMSFGSFQRNGWSNPLDLAWYGRLIHPLSAAGAYLPSDADFRLDRAPEEIEAYYPDSSFALSRNPAFMEWRRGVRTGDAYYYFHHRQAGKQVRFELKSNRRGRVNELIIGDISQDSGDPRLLLTGLQELVRAVRRHRFVTLLSIAMNPVTTDVGLVEGLKKCRFIRLRPRIHFIVKQVADVPACEDPKSWWLLRSDVDTW